MKTLMLTDDEVEDIRFALGKAADRNDEWADGLVKDFGEGAMTGWLREQAERFRALARKVSSAPEANLCPSCGKPRPDLRGVVCPHCGH